MTNLTKQWKKGQLKSFRWYYVKFKTGEIDICWLTEWSNYELGTGGQYFDGIKEENIIEVLAPVPSYDEYWHMISCLNDQTEILNENITLKELLKEVNDYLPEFEIPMSILTKIDEALK